MVAGLTAEQWTLIASMVIAACAVGALILNGLALLATQKALETDRARTAAEIASRDPGLSVRLDLCAYGYDINGTDRLSGPPYGEILLRSRLDVYVHRLTILEVQVYHPREDWRKAGAEATPAIGAFEYQGQGTYPVHLHESEEQWFFWPSEAEIPRTDISEGEGPTSMDAPRTPYFKVRLEVLVGFEASSTAHAVSRHVTIEPTWHGDKVGNLGSPA